MIEDFDCVIFFDSSLLNASDEVGRYAEEKWKYVAAAYRDMAP